MDLEEFAHDGFPFSTAVDAAENDEVGDDQDQLDESGSSDDPSDAETRETSDLIADKFSSPEELMRAYKTAETRMLEKAKEAEEYRRILDQMGQEAGVLVRRAEEEAFIREMRESFQQDPVATTAMMVKKYQEDSRRAIEAKIEEAIRDQGNFKSLLDEFLNDPANSGLRPYERELEFLIRGKGFYPHEAADLVRTLETKRDLAAKRRSAAAKEVRNRAQVESGGEISQPVDDDREFLRLMKKAKTLDEMFATLRKTKI